MAKRPHPTSPPPWEAPLTRMNLLALPPLPPIDDPVLLERSLTHRTFFQDDASLQLLRLQNDLSSFKQLEFIGDAHLLEFTTTHLVEVFPNLDTGALTTIRSSLISNITLSYFARHYGLPDKLRVGSDAHRRRVHETQSTLADAFEARVGALWVQARSRSKEDGDFSGLTSLEEWLTQVYSSSVLPGMESYAKALEVKARVKAHHLQKNSGPKQKRVKVFEGEKEHQGLFGDE